MRRGFQFGLMVLGLAGTSLAYGAASLTTANAALQAGKADEASAQLTEILLGDPNNAEANNLLCRVEYATERFDAASGHCEKAVGGSAQNARYHLWLGRVFGERASRVSFLSAFALAKKAREQFEIAAKLDPRDADVLADLGEFYKEAPGAVGGGTDKAEAIAKQLDAVDAGRAHVLRAEIAEKQKDLAGAEKEFKAAAAGKRAAFGWMELASFYRRQQRWADLDAAVTSGVAAAKSDRRSVVALFNGASILQRANRQPELAVKLFESYVASPDKTEEAPAFEALTRLAKLRKQTGDAAGAQRDKAAALGLARDYKPAQELKL